MSIASTYTPPARLLLDRGDGAPIIIPLLGAPLVLGRLDSCDVQLDDSSVSRLHARIYLRDDQHMVEDLGSRQGTLVNGARIAEPTALRDGDVMVVGGAQLRYLVATP